ncbi:globin family protein [Enterobacter bugandensis]|uniref:globin n=1 Tax=Enterobacter bugandensis TaxID=881260 RepID=UPI001F2603AE|nr:globin [Enterobacter bugandensis]
MKFYRDLFESSLNRVFPNNEKTAFFQTFYDSFVHMSPETEAHFSRLPDREGQQILFKSFFAMLAVDGALIVPDFLERLAREQSDDGLHLPPRFFALWREAMLNAVSLRDPQCDDEILTAWAMAIAPGLEYLRRQAELHYRA